MFKKFGTDITIDWVLVSFYIVVGVGFSMPFVGILLFFQNMVSLLEMVVVQYSGFLVLSLWLWTIGGWFLE